MTNRGMMKWAPYKSLIEQDAILSKMRYKRNKKSRPILSDDEKETINRCLSQYNGEMIKIDYFFDGYIYKIETKIKRIDIENQQLILTKGKILFKDIVHLENSEDLY